MPKRSNDFQKLVYLIRSHLSGDSRVAESKMLRDRITKAFREVDVVIEGSVGGLPVLVSVECRDHKRISDVSWVEAMKTKHERLPTNALILASSSGFTPEAQRVAEAYGIELIALERSEEVDFAGLLGATGTLWHKAVSVTAERVTVTTVSADGLTTEQVVTVPDNLLYLDSGTEAAQIQEVVQHLLNLPKAGDFLVRETTEDHKWFELVSKDPRTPSGAPFYMRKLSPTELRRVVDIRVIGPCTLEMARFGLSHGKLGSVSVSWGRAVVAGKSALAVATKDECGHSKLSIVSDGEAVR